uniref:Hydrophobic seed protein domain-containing protein n=1 Tax=Kalanchoe fedtschenkoi TaxID=63787 RepID=A0A7N0U8Y6_KALFE
MTSSKISALFFLALTICISSISPSLACGSCSTPVNPPKHETPKTPINLPPVTVPVPPVTIPPVGGLPPVGKLPPVGGVLPPVGGLPPVGVLPPVGGLPNLPPVGGVLPPVGGLPNLPPVGGVLPPVGGLPNLPPVGGVLPPVGGLPPITKPGPTPCTPPKVKPPKVRPPKCPINTLKLGACVDLLGGAVNIRLGGPVVNACCPVLKGLAKLEAAACLCTGLKVKALNLKVYVPIALQVLISCGKTLPPGYTCSI